MPTISLWFYLFSNLFSEKHRQLATEEGGIETATSATGTETSYEFEIRNQNFRPIC